MASRVSATGGVAVSSSRVLVSVRIFESRRYVCQLVHGCAFSRVCLLASLPTQGPHSV